MAAGVQSSVQDCRRRGIRQAWQALRATGAAKRIGLVEIARTEFQYLGHTPSKVETAVADARLVLEREAPQQFDLPAIDAFLGIQCPCTCSRERRLLFEPRAFSTARPARASPNFTP